MQIGDPDPERILDGEDRRRANFDDRERQREATTDLRHRLEQHRDQVDDDEHDEGALDGARQPILDAADLKEVIDASLSG